MKKKCDMEIKRSKINWTREDFVALINRGREIKSRRQSEAQERWQQRQQQKKIAAESGYYDLEWV